MGRAKHERELKAHKFINQQTSMSHNSQYNRQNLLGYFIFGHSNLSCEVYLDFRVFESGSSRFFLDSYLSKHLDPICTCKYSIWILVGSFEIQIGSDL